MKIEKFSMKLYDEVVQLWKKAGISVGSSDSKEELIEWCQTNISPFKYPRIIEIVPELPKSVIGKILRRELRKEGE
jgi:acyl-coenzyme A synthetase/AMP-(fatty) acid ligase